MVTDAITFYGFKERARVVMGIRRWRDDGKGGGRGLKPLRMYCVGLGRFTPHEQEVDSCGVVLAGKPYVYWNIDWNGVKKQWHLLRHGQ